jgi:hypothetical protein
VVFQRDKDNRPSALCVVALARDDGEKYFYLFDRLSLPETMRAIAQDAANKELSLTLDEAAELCQRARELSGPDL